MGVLVGALTRAKVSSLGGVLPWMTGLQLKRPLTVWRSALTSLAAFLDRTGSLAQKGSGCALRMGKGLSDKSRRPFL